MGVKIVRHDAKGYKPLVDFAGWRVAILNQDGFQNREKVPYIERHLITDEVFVLLAGKARLMDGGTGQAPRARLMAIPLKAGSVYNVAKRTWHFTLMSNDAKILIVENRNTSKKNSEYHHFSVQEKKAIRNRF